MSWICNDCKMTFEKPIFTEIGYELWARCPECDSEDIESAFTCDVCGNDEAESKLFGYDHCVCEECIDAHRYDLPLLLKATQDERLETSIPALARYLLSDAEIETLLIRELERKLEVSKTYSPAFDTTKFIHDYRDLIADEIVEEQIND